MNTLIPADEVGAACVAAIRGRPSEYTQEIADEICAQLAEGKSLRSVCKADSMPCVRTIFNWFRAYPEFLQQYARAKEECADALADEILDIADDGSNDWMQSNDDDNPGWRVNGEHIQRSRVRIDTRKWIASKLKPKKYGDKVAVGGDPENPVVIKDLVIRAIDATHSRPTEEGQ